MTSTLWKILCLCAALLCGALPALAQDAPAQDDSDKGYLTRLLQDSLGGEGRTVSIDGFEGAFSSTATIERITVADPKGVWLTLNDVQMQWTRSALLRGRVKINELSAKKITLARLPEPVEPDLPAPEAPGFSLPDLPVSVLIELVKAERIVLQEPVLGQAAEMQLSGSLRLDGGEAEAAFQTKRLDGKRGAIEFSASYAEADQAINIALKAEEEQGGLAALLLDLPGRPSVDLTFTGNGTLDDFLADLRLATAGTERLTGRIEIRAAEDGDPSETPARLFTAQLGGDVTPLFAPEYRSFFGQDVRLSLRGRRAPDGALALNEMSLDTRALTLDGMIRLNPDMWPEAMDLDGRIATGDGGAVLLPLPGPRTEIGNLSLSLKYDRATDDGFDGHLDLAGLRRDGLRLGRARADMTGTLRGDVGTIGQLIARTRLSVSGLDLPDPALSRAVGREISGQFVLNHTEGQPLQLNDLRIEAGGAVLTGKATAEDLQNALRTNFETALEIDDLDRLAGLADRPLEGAAKVELSGSADLGGHFDLTVAGNSTDLGIGQPQADALLAGRTALDIRARRDATGSYLDQLDLRNDQMSLKAGATLATGNSDMRLEARIEDASLLSPQLSGPLTLDGTAAQRGEDITVDLDASGPFGATASVEGQIAGDTPRIRFSASLPDVAPLVPQLSGPARIEGRLGGDADVWTLDARAKGPEGLTADLQGPVAGAPLRLEFDAGLPDVSAFAPQLDGAVQATGALTQRGDTFVIDARLNGPEDLRAQVSGPVAGAPLRLDFDATLPDVAAFAPQLDGPLRAEGTLAQRDGNFRIDATAQGPFNATAQVAGTVTGRAPKLEFALSLPDVAPLAPQFRGAASVNGTLQGDGTVWTLDATASGPYGLRAQARGPVAGTPVRLDVSARLPNVGAVVPQFGGPLQASGRVAQDSDGWQVSLDATGLQGTQATVSGRLGADGALRAQAQGALPLGLANPFLRPRSLNGMARFDLRIAGAPSLNAVTGTIRTQGASFSAPAFKLLLTDLSGAVTLDAGRAQVDLTGTPSDGGQVRISGPVTLSGGFPADLSFVLRGARLVDPKLYDTTLNADLRIGGALRGGASVTGRIDVGETLIRVPSSGISGGGPIPEIRHVGAPADVRATRERAGLTDEGGSGNGAGDGGPVYGLDILIDAPARIFVRGRGLDAEIGGSFRVTGTTRNTLSSGSLNLIRGRIDILQKRFELDEGSVQLQGDFNPFVRFVATTQTDVGTASVVIEGPATEPQVHFRSSPEAPEEEVLSQIFFGRDLTQISAFQALQLASAVATLAGRGGEGIVSKLRRGFGFDDLDITTNAEGDTELRVGKYITDNVYTDVTVGPENATDLSINLDLSPSLTAKGTVGSDNNSSLGLFYEKDY